MPLEYRRYSFSIDKGRPEETGPYVGIFEETHRAKGRLAVVAFSEPPQAAGACEHVIEIIGSEFNATRQSLTSGLLVGIKTANRELVRANLSTAPRNRAEVHVGCVVLRGDEAYLASRGQTAIYLFHEGRFEQIDQDQGEGNVARRGLGVIEDLEILLQRHVLQHGDLLLIASEPLTRFLTPRELAELAQLDPSDVMRRVFARVRRQHQFAVMAIGAQEQIAPAPRPRPPEPPPPPPLLGPAPTSVRPASLPLPPVVAPDLRVDPRAPTVPYGEDWPAGPGMAPLRPRPPAPPAGGLRGWLEAHRPPPQRPPRVAGSGLPIGKLDQQLFASLVIGAAVLLVALSFLFPGYIQGQVDDRFGRSLAKVEELRQEANAQTEPAPAREKLAEANQWLNLALSIRRNDPQAARARTALAADQDRWQKTFRLDDTRDLALESILGAAPGELARIDVLEQYLFLLDRGLGQVYRVQVSPSGDGLVNTSGKPVLVKKGEDLGASSAFGEPVSLSVLLPGGCPGVTAPTLLMIDKGRNLWEYAVGGKVQANKLRDVRLWGDVRQIVGAGGALWVLDPKFKPNPNAPLAGQVWRYYPKEADCSFDTLPGNVIDGADLSDAVDLTVPGKVFVLMASGKLWRTDQGRAVEVAQDGFGKPLAQPSAIYTNVRTRSLYLADAGNQRILVLDKEGKFERQLLLTTTEPIRVLAVDEEQGRLYYATDRKLYLASLPKR